MEKPIPATSIRWVPELSSKVIWINSLLNEGLMMYHAQIVYWTNSPSHNDNLLLLNRLPRLEEVHAPMSWYVSLSNRENRNDRTSCWTTGRCSSFIFRPASIAVPCFLWLWDPKMNSSILLVGIPILPYQPTCCIQYDVVVAHLGYIVNLLPSELLKWLPRVGSTPVRLFDPVRFEDLYIRVPCETSCLI